MSGRVVVAVLWVMAACVLVGYLAGLVSLRLNEQDWSQVAPVRVVRHPVPSCGRAGAVWCP